jgi:threonine 3-dehydrogenase
MFETWYKMQSMIQSGLDITPIITNRFSYKDYKEGFELMSSGNSGKIILDWENI